MSLHESTLGPDLTIESDEVSILDEKEKTKLKKVALSNLELLQFCKMATCIRKRNFPAISKLLKYGVPDLLNYVHPTDEIATSLSIAASLNDEEMIIFLIKNGADPNIKDLKGRSALMFACRDGNVESLKALVSNKGNTQVIDNDGNNILFYCMGSSSRHYSCCDICLQNSSISSSINKFGIPLLLAHVDNMANSDEICLLILKHGADPNAVDKTTNRTPLMGAALNNRFVVMNEMLKIGVNNINDTMNLTKTHVVHEAAKAGNLQIMQLLSAYGANFNQQTSNAYDWNLTPLHILVERNQTKACLFAGQRGTDALLKSRDGLTPAMLANKLGFRQTARACRAAQVFSPSRKRKGKNKERGIPIWLLQFHDYIYLKENQILEAFTTMDPENTGKVPMNSYHTVAEQFRFPIPFGEEKEMEKVIGKCIESDGQLNYINFILGKGYIPKKQMASTFETNPKRARPIRGRASPNLFICRMEKDGDEREIIKAERELFDPRRFDRDNPPKNAFENDSSWYMGQNEKEFTTITDAITKKDEPTIKSLLEKLEVEMEKKKNEAEVDEHGGEKNNFGGNIDEKRKVGGTIEARNNYYKTPLMTAILNNNLELVKNLIDLGANVNSYDNFLWTPLHLACHVGSLEIIELLLEHGANVNILSFNWATPLFRAVESSSIEAVNQLIEKKTDFNKINRRGQGILKIAKAFANYFVFQFILNLFSEEQRSSILKQKEKIKLDQSKSESVPMFEKSARTHSFNPPPPPPPPIDQTL